MLLLKYWFCFVCLFLFSCTKEDLSETNPFESVVIVYMGADNNLDAESYQKLTQIKQGWQSSSQNKLLIYQDTPYNDCPRLVEISDSEKGYTTVASYPSSNSADPEVFHSILNEITTLYPAKNYGLIIFSHASGWLPSHTLETHPRSVIIDNNNEMELADLATAIPDHLFRYIAFEACNMAGIEVAYELKDKAEYIIASSAPIVSPGFTPIYAKNINSLLAYPYKLEAFANSYYNYWDSLSEKKRSATISVIRTSALDELAQITKQILVSTSISNVNVETLQQYDGVTSAPYFFFDFAEYFNSFIDENKKAILQNVLDKCIVYKANTLSYATSSGVFPIKYHSGLTTYIQQETLPKLNNEYAKMKWYKDVFGKLE